MEAARLKNQASKKEVRDLFREIAAFNLSERKAKVDARIEAVKNKNSELASDLQTLYDKVFTLLDDTEDYRTEIHASVDEYQMNAKDGAALIKAYSAENREEIRALIREFRESRKANKPATTNSAS